MEEVHYQRLSDQFSDSLRPVLLPVKAADKEKLEVKIKEKVQKRLI